MIRIPDHPQLEHAPLRAVALVLIPTDNWNFESLAEAASSKYAPLFPKIEHRRVRRIYELVDDQDDGVEPSDITIPDDQPHMRLMAENEETYLSVGPRFLGFHQSGYEGWSKLRLLLFSIMDVAFSDRDVIEFEFISLKYDNELDFHSKVEDIINPWLLPLPYPEEEASDLIAYQGTRMIEFHDGSQRISINFPLISESSGDTVVELSIDHSQIFPTDKVSKEDLIQWLDIAHDRIYSTFVSSIRKQQMEALE